MKENKNKRVVMAMSGGIDSSVAAALLKKDGFDVIGVFMKFWADGPKCIANRCCTPESEKRARLVAEKLGISFYVFNFEKEFKNKVVNYFLKQEKAGLTPNPCVICNKEIKFGLLFKKALSLDADYIATGHYVNFENGKLLKGRDKNKDQSYFLWQLSKKTLKKTLFPVGGYTKAEVRKLAEKFKLPVINIPESQEICFIQTTISNFLLKHLKSKPGNIVDNKGGVLGKHQGLFLYTIGQRKGIGLSGGPYYVLDKKMKKNILVVTKNERDLYGKELSVKNINWINKVKLPLKVSVKIRYRHKPALAEFDGKKVKFFKAQRAITSGQSAVFYLPAGKAGQAKELLGGGIII